MIKDIIKAKGHNGFVDFLGWYESQENKEVLLEQYGKLALEALYPNAQVYDLNHIDWIPAVIVEKYKLSYIDQGQGTRGGDLLVVDTYQTIILDAKSKQDYNKSVDGNVIARKYATYIKLKEIAPTPIDKFGIITDSTAELTVGTKKDMDVDVYLKRDDLFNKALYRKIVKRINKEEQEIEYTPYSFRENYPFSGLIKGLGKVTNLTNFFERAMEILKKDVTNYWSNNQGIPLFILNNWPAGTGKTSFWILCYYHIFVHYISKDQLNLVLSHNNTVMANNVTALLKHIHALSLKDKSFVPPRIVLYSNKALKSESEEDSNIINMYCEYAKGNKFRELINTPRNYDMWIFCLNHNYDALEFEIQDEEKEIYFATSDEVHHLVQPADAGWSGFLQNKYSILKNVLGLSANKKVIDDLTGTSSDMEVGATNTWQLKVLELSEKLSHQFRWKRIPRLKIAYYSNKFLKNQKLITAIQNKKKPNVHLRNLPQYKKGVPLYWWINADAYLKYKLENQGKYHTLGTLNSLINCRQYAKFLQAYIDKMLIPYAHEYGYNGNSIIVKRLQKLHIKVADTDKYDTAKYLREVEAIPQQLGGSYEDSLVLHCRLLGEGWSPEKGWIDSGQFIDPAYSPIKIYQFVERGARLAEQFSIEENDIIYAYWNEDDGNINLLFNKIKDICEALKIAIDPISEEVVFDWIGDPRVPGTPRTPRNNSIFHEDADLIYNGFMTYYQDGKYISNYGVACHYLNRLEEETKKHLDDEYFLFSSTEGRGQTPDKIVKDEVFAEHSSKFHSRVTFGDFCTRAKQGQLVSSLQKQAYNISKTKTKAKETLIKQNKPLILNAYAIAKTQIVKDMFEIATLDRNSFDEFCNRIFTNEMAKLCPIHAPCTSVFKTPYTQDMQGHRLITERCKWYGIVPDWSTEFAQVQIMINTVNAVLQEEADKIFYKEPNFYKPWKIRLSNMYGVTPERAGKNVSRITQKKGFVPFLNDKKIKSNNLIVKNLLLDTAKHSKTIGEWQTNFYNKLNKIICPTLCTESLFNRFYKQFKFLDFTQSEIETIKAHNKRMVSHSTSISARKKVANPNYTSNFIERNKLVKQGKIIPGFKNKGIPVEIVDVLNGIKVNKEFANKHRALEYLQNIEFKVADARVKNPKNIKLREPTLDTILRRCNSDNYPGWKLLKTKRTDSR